MRGGILALLLLPLAACQPPAALLSCAGAGEVRGSYAEINSGELRFAHGVAWRDAAGYSVLFTGDALLAEALRGSPQPEKDAALAGAILHELLVGYRFAADGEYLSHSTLGSSTSSGSGGGDHGSLDDDGAGCVRGEVSMTHYGGGRFALPLQDPTRLAALLDGAVESPEPHAAAAAPAAQDELTPLQRWAEIHARLQQPHPGIAWSTLGLSWPAAETLAADPRMREALRRLVTQCPDPASAELDSYGDVVGEAQPAPGIRLAGTVVSSGAGDALWLQHCYVMQRNDEYIDQCWPQLSDCSIAPTP